MCIRVAHCLKVEVVRWARRADGGGGAAVVNKRPRLEEGRPVSVATDADPVGHDVVIVVVRCLLFPIPLDLLHPWPSVCHPAGPDPPWSGRTAPMPRTCTARAGGETLG